MFKIIKNEINTPSTINHSPLTHKGQVILEFTFSMIVVLIMLYGVVKVFHWAGKDIVERRIAHDTSLEDQTGVDTQWGPKFGNQVTTDLDPRGQINPNFYAPTKMNAIWDGR